MTGGDNKKGAPPLHASTSSSAMQHAAPATPSSPGLAAGQEFVSTGAGKVPVEQWQAWQGLASATVSRSAGSASERVANGVLLQRQVNDWGQQHQQQHQQQYQQQYGTGAPLNRLPSAASATSNGPGANNVLHQLLSEAVQSSLAKVPSKSLKSRASGERVESAEEEKDWIEYDGDADYADVDGEGYGSFVDELVQEVLCMRLKMDHLESENESLKRTVSNQKQLMEQMQKSLMQYSEQESVLNSPSAKAPSPLRSPSPPPIIESDPVFDFEIQAASRAVSCCTATAARTALLHDAGRQVSPRTAGASGAPVHGGTPIPESRAAGGGSSCNSHGSGSGAAISHLEYGGHYGGMQSNQVMPPFYHPPSATQSTAATRVHEMKHQQYVQNQHQQYASDAARLQGHGASSRFPSFDDMASLNGQDPHKTSTGGASGMGAMATWEPNWQAGFPSHEPTSADSLTDQHCRISGQGLGLGTDSESWTCSCCTYKHEDSESSFLRCKVCTSVKL